MPSLPRYAKLVTDAEQASGRTSNNPTDKLLTDLRALRPRRRLRLVSGKPVICQTSVGGEQVEDLYFRESSARGSKAHSEVLKLSDLLN